MPSNPAFLRALATAVPRHRHTQGEIEAFMGRALGPDPARLSFLRKVYAGAAIDARYSVLPDFGAACSEPVLFGLDGGDPGTGARNQIFRSESDALALEAARSLFDADPSLDVRSVTHLVTVSCTGFAAPGFDYALMRGLGLKASVQRFHVGFMGCFAAFPALRLARALVAQDSAARVLVVDVELCTLHFRRVAESDAVVSAALFADGAAAALVDGREGPLEFKAFQSKLLDDTSGDMAWTLGDRGFEMKLSSYVPRIIEANLGPAVDELLAEAGTERAGVASWAVHPGGRAILDRAAEALGLDRRALDAGYGVLKDYGNMSSATIFFVLQRLLAGGAKGPLFACAFGPGLTVESGLMEAL